MSDDTHASDADGKTAEFERVRERAAEAARSGDADSVYLGLVGGETRNEYYFANDVDESELREVAAQQLGMLTRVLAEQSDASIDEVAEHAAETARKLNVR